MTELIECYDVGGTNLRGALIGYPEGNIKASQTWDTLTGSVDELLSQIGNLSKSIRNGISDPIVAVSLGLPGPVENDVLLESPPLQIHTNVNIVSELGKNLLEPIFIDNDLNTAVRAELKLGIGKSISNFCLLTISTGIGAGLVLDGKMLGGASGEFGHCVLERDSSKANRCSCGRSGCWGAMASGQGIDLTIKKEFENSLTVKELFENYEAGDRKAKEIVDKVRDYNAHGIGNILNALSLDAVVLMGSIGLNQSRNIIPPLEQLGRYTINKIPKIMPTALGDNIGLLGAYILACEKLGEQFLE